jgi:transaldolase
MKRIGRLRIKLFCDGARLEDFKAMRQLSHIKGFTTNPTLMKKAGVTDYEAFAKQVLPETGGKPISFEVVSDDFAEMKRQALRLHALGSNVYVKIPVTNTQGEPAYPLVRELSAAGVKINVTAILTLQQVRLAAHALSPATPGIISVFAGRIADTGRDPMPVMRRSKKLLRSRPKAELLWASPRELLNIFHAEECGCDIITVVPDILKKLEFVGYDLRRFSLDTVKMFFDDAKSSGLRI